MHQTGIVAPDEITFAYLRDRPQAPKGLAWDQALAYWRSLPSDDRAAFDAEHHFSAEKIAPSVTWGTNPEHAAAIDGVVPDPGNVADPEKRQEIEAALDYMALTPGTPLAAITVDRVFIGSCTNSRIEDLRSAAAIARRGRAVVPTWVVPGSTSVKRQAESEGLDRIFIDAGFEWHDAGCSLCTALNGDTLAEGERCASTSNRNFRGRQGRNGRTHLLSPAMAAAAALTGRLTDVRKLRYLKREYEMDSFITWKAIAVPFDQANIDTNQLCPTRFNKVEKGPKYAKVLFHDLRFHPDGSEKRRFHPERAAVSARRHHCCRP